MKKNRLLPFFAVLVLTVSLSLLLPATVARAVSFYQYPSGAYIPYSSDMYVSYSASGLTAYEDFTAYASLDAEPYPPSHTTLDERCVENGSVTVTLPLSGPRTYTAYIFIVNNNDEVVDRFSAVFTAYTDKITLDSQGGSAVSPLYFVPDTPSQTLPTPTRTGYVFDGWFTEEDGGSQVASPVDACTTTLYAHWTLLPEYTVTFDANGGSVSPTTATTVSGKLSSLPTPTYSGYNFEGWFTAVSGGTKVDTSKVYTVNTTLYAQWTRIEYTVTFEPNGGTVDPASAKTAEGKVSLPNPTYTGYDFVGWFTEQDAGTEVTSDTVFDVDSTVYAHWTAAGAYTITFDLNGGAFNKELTDTKSRTVTTANGKVAAEDFLSPYKLEHQFLGWFTKKTDGEKVTADTEFTEDTTVYAQWYKGTPPEKKVSDSQPAVTLTLTSDKDTYLLSETVYLTLKTTGLADGEYSYTLSYDRNGEHEGSSDAVFSIIGGEAAISLSGLTRGTYKVTIGLEGEDASVEFRLQPYNSVSNNAASLYSTTNSSTSSKYWCKDWYKDEYGVWRIRNSSGQTVNNAWLCDDAIASSGQNNWYFLDTNGEMSSNLVPDSNGNCYSLVTAANGTYGMLRYTTNGDYYVNGVFLDYNESHNGSFGATVPNEFSIDKLKEIYGGTRYGIGNENSVYTSNF